MRKIQNPANAAALVIFTLFIILIFAVKGYGFEIEIDLESIESGSTLEEVPDYDVQIPDELQESGNYIYPEEQLFTEFRLGKKMLKIRSTDGSAFTVVNVCPESAPFSLYQSFAGTSALIQVDRKDPKGSRTSLYRFEDGENELLADWSELLDVSCKKGISGLYVVLEPENSDRTLCVYHGGQVTELYKVPENAGITGALSPDGDCAVFLVTYPEKDDLSEQQECWLWEDRELQPLDQKWSPVAVSEDNHLLWVLEKETNKVGAVDITNSENCMISGELEEAVYLQFNRDRTQCLVGTSDFCTWLFSGLREPVKLADAWLSIILPPGTISLPGMEMPVKTETVGIQTFEGTFLEGSDFENQEICRLTDLFICETLTEFTDPWRDQKVLLTDEETLYYCRYEEDQTDAGLLCRLDCSAKTGIEEEKLYENVLDFQILSGNDTWLALTSDQKLVSGRNGEDPVLLLEDVQGSFLAGEALQGKEIFFLDRENDFRSLYLVTENDAEKTDVLEDQDISSYSVCHEKAAQIILTDEWNEEVFFYTQDGEIFQNRLIQEE